MIRTRTLMRFAGIGLATAMIAPAGAGAQPADASGVTIGGSGVMTRSAGAPDPAYDNHGPYPSPRSSATVAGQDLHAPTAPQWPVHPQTLHRPAATSSGDGIDTGVLIGLGGLALVALVGVGLTFRMRLRAQRHGAAA